MKLETIHNEILEYLNRRGSVNTFRLSRDLKIERKKLINLIKELANEKLIKFKSGVITKGDKQLANQKIIRKELKEEKLAELPKIQPVPETTKKSKILDYSKLEEVKKEIQKLENKEEKLKKEIEDLQTQRKGIALKLAEERERLNQIQKEREEVERGLAEREKFVGQREESASSTLKKIKREKEKISKAKVLKKDISKLEAILEDLKKKADIEERKLKKLKEKESKLVVPKQIKKPKRKQAVEEFELEKEEPKLEKQRYGPVRLEEQKVGGIVSYPETHIEPEITNTQSALEKTYESLRQGPREDRELLTTSESVDFAEHEEIKPTLKSKIKKIIGKIKVSKSENKQPEIIAKEPWQATTEIGKEKIEDKFHELIEQEINLLNQKKNYEAREVHLKIKGMISEVTDPDKKKTIVTDWDRVKEFY